MAISHDTDSTIGTAATTSPATWNHTCVGTDLALVVFLEVKASPSPIIDVSYGGVAMTNLPGASVTDAGNLITVDCWYLLNPLVGTNAISINWTTGAARRLLGVATSLRGVLGIGTSNTASGTNSGGVPQPAVSLTPSTDNCFVVGATGVNDNTPLVATSGTLFGQVNDSLTPFHTLTGAYKSQPSAPGVISISFNNTVSTDSWVIGAASFTHTSLGDSGSYRHLIVGDGVSRSEGAN